MGRLRIQLLIEDNIWSIQYTMAKNNQYSDSSTDWTLINLKFTREKYSIRLVYDQIDIAQANLCFNNVTITHFVY